MNKYQQALNFLYNTIKDNFKITKFERILGVQPTYSCPNCGNSC